MGIVVDGVAAGNYQAKKEGGTFAPQLIVGLEKSAIYAENTKDRKMERSTVVRRHQWVCLPSFA